MAIALAACGDDYGGDGKLLAQSRLGVGARELGLARAHDFDRLCESLYLQTPPEKQLAGAVGEAKTEIASYTRSMRPGVRRGDDILLHDQIDPKAYESIFVGYWRPPDRGGRRAGYALFTPFRCIVTAKDIRIFELEPASAEKADTLSAERVAAVVAKYSRVPLQVREAEQQKDRDPAERANRIVRESGATQAQSGGQAHP